MLLRALLEAETGALGPQLPDRSAGFLAVLERSLSPLGLNAGRAGPLESVSANIGTHQSLQNGVRAFQ